MSKVGTGTVVKRSGLLIAIVLVMHATSFRSLRAETPLGSNRVDVVSLPLNLADTKGYTVDLNWDQQMVPGYMSIEIQVTSTSTFAADRQLSLRLEPLKLGHSPPQNGMTIDIPISISQGKKQEVVNRLVPKWSVGNGYQLKLFDDGIEREQYRAEIGQIFRRYGRANTELLTTDIANDWLIVCEDDDRKSIKPFLSKNYPIMTSQSTGRRVPQTQPSTVRHSVVTPTRLPKDWRELQWYDAVVMKAELVQKVATEQPERFMALRQWMLCGGTIIVFNAESLDQVTQALNVADSETVDEDDRVTSISMSLRAEHWQVASSVAENIKAIQDYIAQSRTRNSNGQNMDMTMSTPTQQELDSLPEMKSRLAELQATAPDPSQSHRVWLTRAGAGQVIGLAKASRLDQYDLTLVAKLFGYRQSPMLRRGVDPLLGDQRVGRWLIPGVAQPPVYTFIGLLTLFTILVGPVAYRMTTKQGRGYLMFAIAPVLAIITTATMLIYGVLSDGFGTQTRIRQVTWVDGITGDAGERIRGTYFAGVRPTDGITFAADAEVFAYPNNHNESWESLNERTDTSIGSVLVADDRQQFDSGYLPSRSQQQFVVHRPRQSLGRLNVLPPSSPTTTAKLSSDFDFDLYNVVVHDRDGNYWATAKVQANASGVACNRSYGPAASKALGKLYNDHRPVSATREVNRNSYSNRTRDIISIMNRRTGDQSKVVTDGVFEYWLQQQLSIAGELPSGYFIALADVSDDVVWVKGAEKVASVRYVIGTLP